MARENRYELVMPFVACASQGGPYEDNAFVAGYQAGRLDHALGVIAAVEGEGLKATVRTDLLNQMDLIAMRHGFRLETEETGAEGWSYVKFQREEHDQ